jgi:hypothetical protein
MRKGDLDRSMEANSQFRKSASIIQVLVNEQRNCVRMLQARLDGNFYIDGWFNITLKLRNEYSNHNK